MTGKSDGSVIIDTRMNTDGFGKGVKTMKGQINGLSGAVGKLGAVIATVFVAGKIARLSKEAIKLGSDLQEVQNVVDVTFTTMNEQVNEFAKNAAETAGLSETMAKRYAGTFGAMAKAFGFAESESYNMATALTQLAGDVASFYNLTQDEAYTKLKSVFTGETESLKDLGVVMTQTALDSFAMANGYGKATKAMSEAEKVALRFAFVTNQLNAASGDFVRTSGSWANMIRILTLNFDSFKANVGQALINIFTPFLQVINQIVAKMAELSSRFLVFTQLLTGKGASGGGSPGKALEDIASGYGDVEDATKAAEKAQKSYTSGLDELNIISKDTGGSGAVGGGAVSIPTVDIVPDDGKTNEAISRFDERITELIGMFDALKKALSNLWNEGLKLLMDFSADTLKDFYKNFLVPVGKWVIGEGLPRFVNITNELLKGINWKKLQYSLDDFYEELARITILSFDSLLDFYDFFLKPVAQWTIGKAFPTLLDILTDFSKKINWEKINKGLEALYKVLGKYTVGIGEGLLHFFEGFYDFLSPSVAGIINLFAEGFEALFNAMLLMPEGVLVALGGALGGLLSMFVTYKGVIAAMDGLQTAWTSLYVAFDDGLKLLTAHPYMAAAAGISAIVGAMLSLQEKAKETQEIETYGQKFDDMVRSMEKSREELEKRTETAIEFVNNAGAAELLYAEDLKEKYLALSEKQSLSNEEYADMQFYSSELVRILPNLNDYLNEETGLLNIQADTLDSIIEKQKEYYRVKAAENKIEELYATQLEMESQLKDSQDALKKATEEYNAALEKSAQFKRDMWENAGIKDETEQVYVTEAREKWEALTGEVNNARIAYNNIGADINEMLGIMNEGTKKINIYASEAGLNYAVGMGNGIKDNSEMAIDAAGGMVEDINNTVKEKAGINSPSKVTYEYGSYYVDGFALGISENSTKSNEAISAWVASMNQTFMDSLDMMMAGWTEKMTTWFQENVLVYFSEETWMEILALWKELLLFDLEDMTMQWDEIMLAWWEEAVNPYFDQKQWTVFGNNMKTGIITGLKALVGEITGIMNQVINVFNSALKNIEKSINDLVEQFNDIAFELGVGSLNKVHYTPIRAIKVPYLATGAVIPPNAPFMAMLGDQRHGTNLEAPEDLIRQIVREEAGGSREMLELLARIADSNQIIADKDLTIGDREIARANLRGQREMGYTLITEG